MPKLTASNDDYEELLFQHNVWLATILEEHPELNGSNVMAPPD